MPPNADNGPFIRDFLDARPVVARSWGSETTAIEGATDTLVRQQMLGAVAPRRRWGADGGQIGITRP